MSCPYPDGCSTTVTTVAKATHQAALATTGSDWITLFFLIGLFTFILGAMVYYVEKHGRD